MQLESQCSAMLTSCGANGSKNIEGILAIPILIRQALHHNVQGIHFPQSYCNGSEHCIITFERMHTEQLNGWNLSGLYNATHSMRVVIQRPFTVVITGDMT